MTFLAPQVRAGARWGSWKSRQGPSQREEDMDCVHYREPVLDTTEGNAGEKDEPLNSPCNQQFPHRSKGSEYLLGVDCKTCFSQAINQRRSGFLGRVRTKESVRIATHGHMWETERDKPKLEGEFCFSQSFDCVHCAWNCCWTNVQRA